MTFIDENCVIFDNEEENKLVYYDKFNEFRTLIDNLLNTPNRGRGHRRAVRGGVRKRLREQSASRCV